MLRARRWRLWSRSLFSRPVRTVAAGAGRPALCVGRLEDRLTPAGTITGFAFEDYNANGTRDLTTTVASSGQGTTRTAVDRGLAGVTVTVADAGGNVRGTATTDATGAYTVTATGTGPYRVEFSTLPAGFSPGPHGPDSGTTVQFVPDGNSTNVSLGLTTPADYYTNTPTLVSSRFVFGDQQGGFGTQAVVQSIPYNAGSTNGNNPASPGATTLATANQVGTIFGLAAAQGTGATIYAAAFMRKHAGFGPNGTGAIYSIDPTTGTVGLFVDLNAVFGANTAGADPHNTADYDRDNGDAAWDAVGKTSFGGMAVSPDGQFVYVMNLADRSLYRIPTSGPLNSTTILRQQIPLNAPGATGTNGADLRPFAVEFHNGQLYVGVVNSAQSTGLRTDLHAYVYTADPTTLAFSAAPVFTIADLTYTRGAAESFTNPAATANWEPWASGFTSQVTSAGVYSQPELSGISFDANGNMFLGLRDRGGDQFGFFTLDNPANNTRYEGVAGGDLLIAAVNTAGDLTSGWTLENNGVAAGTNNTVGTTTVGASAQGPGGKEYFGDANNGGIHQEITTGANLQLPGFPDVVSTAFDPLNNVRVGGFAWFNVSTGAKTKGYEIYANSGTMNSPTASPGTFSKANGIGDLIALQPTAPVEIGDRVFQDTNGNGVQDAGEPGIAGVTVRLYDATGTTVLATAVTDANGYYYFSSAAGANSTSAIYNLATLTPNTTFVVKLDKATDYSTGPLAGLAVSPTAAGADRAADSNGALSNGVSVATVTTGGPGTDDHTFDFGFVPPVTVGDFVWDDANGNGVQDAGEPGIAGVTVRLYDPQGNLLASALTDANGGYSFSSAVGTSTASAVDNVAGLTPATAGYSVRLDNAADYATGPLQNYVASPAFRGGNAATDSNGVAASPTDDRAAVTTPAAGGTDRTFDFGLFRPLSLGNLVWNDANNDGTLDNGEAGVGGVAVTLLDNNGNTVGTTTTNAQGYYLFTGLGKGQYRVRIDAGNFTAGNPLAGFTSSTGTPASATGPVEPSTYGSGNNSQDHGTTQPGGFVLGNLISLAAGAAPTGEGATPGRTDPAPDANSDTTQDFGFVQTAAVGDTVFLDANDNGVQDPTETGVAGVTVQLYDATGTTVLRTTTTTAGGAYQFTGLIPGPYQIKFGNSDGTYTYTRSPVGQGTAATDSNANPATGFSGPFTLAPGQTDPTIDAGLFLPLSLGDTVFVDSNNDGVLDNGEAGLDGVTVTLLDSGSNVVGTATTAGGGLYQFTNLAPGTYTVRLSNLPAGYVSSTGANGSPTGPSEPGSADYTAAGNNRDHGTQDPAATTVTSRPVTLTAPGSNPNASASGPGTANQTVDLGVFRPLTLGDTVFVDSNNDGVLDNGEAGLDGVTVTLLDANGATVATATTAGGGQYQFTNLIPGTYTVRLSGLPAGYVSSTGANGAATGPAEPGSADYTAAGNNRDHGTQDATGGTVTSRPVTLTAPGSNPNSGPGGAGSANNNVDLGVFRPLTLGDTVFVDSNNDGVLDNGEAGLDGVTVTLLDANGATVATTVTANGGLYQFTNLVPGTYTVRLSGLPAGYVSSTGANGAATGPAEPGSADYTAAGNNADHGTQDATGGTVTSRPVTLTAPGSNPNASASGPGTANLSVDFGVFRPLSLGDTVFVDANDNGTFDTGEAGLDGVTVTLLDANGATVATATTANGGLYKFTNLVPGTYTVRLSNLPAGYVSSTGTPGAATGPSEPGSTDYTTAGNNADHGTQDPAGSTVTSQPVTLAAPGGNPNAGAGGAGSTNSNVDLGVYQPGSIAGVVYYDANRDGTYTPGTDAPIPGTTVTLTGTVGGVAITPVTVTTGANGAYSFGNLPAGTYTVTETQPAGYTQGTDTVGTVGGTPSGSAGTQDVFSGVVVPAGGAGTGYNFGERRPDVSGTVFVDNDRDQLFDHGESGLATPAVTVTLKDAGTGAVVATTTTGPGGAYTFSNVPPGTYTVMIAPPPGYTPTTPTALTFTQTTAGTGGENFGLVAPLSLGNSVFVDANNNGVRDPGEVGLAGVSVRLLDAAGNPVLGGNGRPLTTTTDATGGYEFDNLPAGTYRVEIAQPAGYVTSTGTNGSPTGPYEPGASGNTDGVDHGTATGGAIRTGVITLAPAGGNPDTVGAVPGNANLRQDFGVYQPLSLGDAVFVDSNDNGRRDAGEAGLDGVTVTLLDGTGAIVATTTTSSGGQYQFTNLTPGTYTVRLSGLPAGYVSSTGTSGATAGPYEPGSADYTATGNDADHGTQDPTGGTVTSRPVTLTAPGTNPNAGGGGVGTANNSVDFGVFRALSIGDFVWADTNNNGVADPGEPGIGGVTVTLLDGSGNTVAATTTNAQGGYLFTGLGAGTYQVRVTPPAGYQSSTGSNGANTGPFEPAPNDNADGRDKGTAAGGFVLGGLVTLAPGAEPTGEAATAGGLTDPAADADGNHTQDFGFIPTATDLAVTVRPDTPTVTLGGTDDVTITVTNNGPATATGTVVSVTLPPGATLVGVDGTTQGVYDPATGLWSVGTLPANGTATLRVRLRADAVGTLLPTATVAADQTETNTTNNISAGPITVAIDPGQSSKRQFLASTTPDATAGRTIAPTSLPGVLANSRAVIATGAGPGTPPLVEVFDRATGQLRLSFLAYDSSFTGGVNVATADVNGDGYPDLVTAPMSGGGPQVKVFDGRTGQLLSTFFAFEPTFTGGVHLAVADVDGDGTPEIVAGAGNGGAPRVVVFRTDGTALSSFFAYDSSFRNGVNVAAGDVDGDGTAEIVTGAAAGGGPNVKVFDAAGVARLSFFAYDPAFRGGVTVATGDVDGDGKAEIVTGAGAGGGPQVSVFRGDTGAAVASYMAFDPAFRGGVTVSSADLDGNGRDDLITAPMAGGGPIVVGLDALTGATLDTFAAYGTDVRAGVNVAAANR